jgi:hypothetical protein
VVRDADDVAGKGLVEQLAPLRQEAHHRVRAQLLAGAHHLQAHAALEVARGDAHEGDAVAMRRVHVGLDLEDDAAELLLVRVHGALDGAAVARRRRQIDEGVEHLAHAEVVDGRAEEHRRLPAGEEGRAVERRRRVGEQLDLAFGLLVLHAETFGELGVVEALDRLVVACCGAVRAGEKTRIRSSRRSITPWKRLPMPTGHVKGTTPMPSSRSISSMSASGSCTSRSILLTKVRIGVLRARQTCSSRRVCGSTPLAASMTISAASTAVRTR